MIQAILFDLDGTLADTEGLGIQTAISVCKEYGVELNPAEKSKFIGITDREFYRTFFEKRELDLSVDEALKKHEEIYDQKLQDKYWLFDGVPEMLKELNEKGYKLALVSGSTRNQIEVVFKNTSLLGVFNCIVSCNDVSLSKPNPEGYILAMKKLNINPQNCVAVEESTTGIQSAISAGLKVVGIENLGGQDISMSDIIVRDINELHNKLKEL